MDPKKKRMFPDEQFPDEQFPDVDVQTLFEQDKSGPQCVVQLRIILSTDTYTPTQMFLSAAAEQRCESPDFFR